MSSTTTKTTAASRAAASVKATAAAYLADSRKAAAASVGDAAETATAASVRAAAARRWLAEYGVAARCGAPSARKSRPACRQPLADGACRVHGTDGPGAAEYAANLAASTAAASGYAYGARYATAASTTARGMAREGRLLSWRADGRAVVRLATDDDGQPLAGPSDLASVTAGATWRPVADDGRQVWAWPVSTNPLSAGTAAGGVAAGVADLAADAAADLADLAAVVRWRLLALAAEYGRDAAEYLAKYADDATGAAVLGLTARLAAGRADGEPCAMPTTVTRNGETRARKAVRPLWLAADGTAVLAVRMPTAGDSVADLADDDDETASGYVATRSTFVQQAARNAVRQVTRGRSTLAARQAHAADAARMLAPNGASIGADAAAAWLAARDLEPRADAAPSDAAAVAGAVRHARPAHAAPRGAAGDGWPVRWHAARRAGAVPTLAAAVVVAADLADDGASVGGTWRAVAGVPADVAPQARASRDAVAAVRKAAAAEWLALTGARPGAAVADARTASRTLATAECHAADLAADAARTVSAARAARVRAAARTAAPAADLATARQPLAAVAVVRETAAARDARRARYGADLAAARDAAYAAHAARVAADLAAARAAESPRETAARAARVARRAAE